MKRLISPLDVQIELTEACNQQCKHCYNYWRCSTDQFKQEELGVCDLVSVINQLHEAKVGLITFTGGEPLLRKNVLFDLVTCAHDFAMDIGLNSNAALITKEDALILAKNGLNHSLISLLGPEKLHESIAGAGANFEATKHGIKMLMDAGIPVVTNMVVTKLNLSVMLETACIAKNMGIKSFCAGPAIPSCKSAIPLCLSLEECKVCLRELMRISEELSLRVDVLEPIVRCLFNKEEDLEFARFFGGRICSAAVSSCAISSSGDMRPCIHSDRVYGNVLPNNFLEVWEKMKDWSLPTILPSKCQSCSAVTLCEGGCRMSARNTCGEYNGQDMYMTDSITDIDRLTLGICTEKNIAVDVDQLLEFNKQCIIRQDAERYIVFVGGKMQCLTEKGSQFILRLKETGIFTVRLIAEQAGFSEDQIEPVLARFLKNGIISRKEV
jgi:radical SAM protein with 4Fe4S-binding SPASM domain